MSNFAHFLSVYVAWVAVPSLAITGIVFWTKQRTKESLVFASGIVLIALGSLIQVFSPFAKMTMDEAGKILSSSGPPLSWYTGSIVVSIGLIVTIVGFASVTWKIKRST
jgi:uncharacterized membrane protein